MDKKIYIVGAHSRAQTLAAYLLYLYTNVSIEAYLYDNDEENPKQIGDTPVCFMDGRIKFFTEYPVFIGTRGIYHQKLIEKLRLIGFKAIYPVTQELDLTLRNQYLERYYTKIGREFNKLDRFSVLDNNNKERKTNLSKSVSSRVYVVRSPFDRALQQKYPLAAYEKEIYAGSVFAEQTLPGEALTDNYGDNISDKNKQFCELTALYWIWKHAEEDIIGLVHYRRHFLLPEDWKKRMIENHIDVILPVPLYVEPNVEENFKRRHDPSDWEFMMQYLNKYMPDIYQTSRDFFKGNLYSPCNMFIMRKEILNELCIWLFPIVFAVAQHGGVKTDPYLNRYPGFVSERLISLFFEKNREKFSVVYSDKNFLH